MSPLLRRLAEGGAASKAAAVKTADTKAAKKR